ncbi:DUF58 domain-containing protein [Dermacoccaceae bacterium W4C1]
MRLPLKPIDPAAGAPTWRVSPVLWQSLGLGLCASILAVLALRPDLLVLATPGLALLGWAVLTQPRRRPRWSVTLSSDLADERHSELEWRAVLEGAQEVEVATAVVGRTDHVDYPQGRRFDAVCPQADEQGRTRAELSLAVHPTRWGSRRIGESTLSATSAWALFQIAPITYAGARIRVLPTPADGEVQAPVPHPAGLIGMNRSTRRGDGSEFADIRAFRPGDRLRHVHWPVTARTGELHVRSFHAEEDAEVHLLVDVALKWGSHPSSLDIQVRLAAALARQLTSRGERVGLATIATSEPVALPPAPGRRQYQRILGMLSQVRISPRTITTAREVHRISPGAAVILLSPLLTQTAAQRAATLSARGHPVIVVDCLPDSAAEQVHQRLEENATNQLAWRLRMLQRRSEIDELRHRGVPVSPPRTVQVDAALRAVGRRPQQGRAS